VLDLEPGVHLQEVGLAGVGVQEELHGAGVLVADVLRQGDRGVGDQGPGLRADRGRRCLLQHLLVTPLGRAVALEEMDDVAVRVGQHLHLDVPAVLDVLLHEDRVVAERGQRLALRGRDGVVELLAATHDAHPLAPAAGRGLDQDGKSKRGASAASRTTGPRRPRPLGDRARGVLATHLLHHAGARTDQHEAGVLDGLGEGGALGEEAVAGVDRVGPGAFAAAIDGVDVEVGVDRDGLVGVVHVRRGAVDLAVHAMVWMPSSRADG
jgi:hypothetical protein